MTEKYARKNVVKRELWLERVLSEIPNGHRILDAGAGELKYKKFCTHLDYISQDFGKYDGCGDGVGLQPGCWDQAHLDIVSDITNIPEDDGSFDAVMCIEVLEHLNDPNKAISELARLIKSGGMLIITAPFCSLTHFSPYHFYSGFNRNFYKIQLEKYDFKIMQIEPNGNYFEFICQELQRVQKISKSYAGDEPNIFEGILMKIILRMLKRFSDKDKGSEELLCFGYHVLARKR